VSYSEEISNPDSDEAVTAAGRRDQESGHADGLAALDEARSQSTSEPVICQHGVCIDDEHCEPCAADLAAHDARIADAEAAANLTADAQAEERANAYDCPEGW
jgi:hypothetical protein